MGLPVQTSPRRSEVVERARALARVGRGPEELLRFCDEPRVAAFAFGLGLEDREEDWRSEELPRRVRHDVAMRKAMR